MISNLNKRDKISNIKYNVSNEKSMIEIHRRLKQELFEPRSVFNTVVSYLQVYSHFFVLITSVCIFPNFVNFLFYLYGFYYYRIIRKESFLNFT
jgi:hypothetical protein